MKIENIIITNFKGLQEVCFRPTGSTCVIGHNNSGKSSLLQAIQTAVEGKSFSKLEFHDLSRPIEVTFSLSGCTEAQLARLGPTHTSKLRPIILNDKIRLRYEQSDGCSSSFSYETRVPKQDNLRYLHDNIKKKNTNEQNKIIDQLGKYAELFTDRNTQKAIIAKRDEIISNLGDNELKVTFEALPSGMPASIAGLLPEVVYVPAVKDLREETKAKESAAFGKLLKITLAEIQSSDEFKEFEQSFDRLSKLLNKTEGDSSRLVQIASIEESLERHIEDHFGKAKIQIHVPSPDLRQVLGNAEILVDDGVSTPIEQKGDGIKRAMLFALIRTYIEIKRKNSQKVIVESLGSIPVERPILFLFEEPELFLHPDAQHKLFKAISNLAELEHQVVITTHSPSFFRLGSTTMFVKLIKKQVGGIYTNPELIHYDLESSLTARDAFQLLCFKNSAAAFFSNKVLLVEGDSDQIYVPEIAKHINSQWNFEQECIPIVQVGGKGNVKRYRTFFESIAVKVFVLVDGDCFSDGYKKLGLSQQYIERCHDMKGKLDKYNLRDQYNLNGNQARRVLQSRGWAEKFTHIRNVLMKKADGERCSDEDMNTLRAMFEKTEELRRRAGYSDPEYHEAEKQGLIVDCIAEGVLILSGGAIESYYPRVAQGSTKPDRAFNAVKCLASMDSHGWLPEISGSDGNSRCELSRFFEVLFE